MIDDDAPAPPEPLKAGDWIACSADHRNWRVLRTPTADAPLRAEDVVSPNGLKPIAGTPVAACSICGESLIVNGNSGPRFRVLRAAEPVAPSPEPFEDDDI